MLALLAGCSCDSDTAPPIDASLADVAMDALIPDAMTPPDADDTDASDPILDAGSDASPIVDAALDASDAALDATLDATLDAFDPCSVCIPESDCETATCVDGACARGLVADQTACGLDIDAGSESTWCIAGECVVAYCGDGIVAPDEACDDHNAINTDACSNACRWQRHAAYLSGPYGAHLTPGAAVAVDGQGTLITVWYENDVSDGPTEVRARRMLASGEVVDETWLTFNNSYQGDPAPVVAGLSGGGFAVALVMMGELYVRTVSASGQLSALQKLSNTLPVSGSTIATLGSGFVVAWSRDGNVYAQRYSASGSALGSRITVNTSVGSMLSNSHFGARIASRGDDWLVVWVRSQMPGNPVERSIYGRRFSGGSALDSTEQLYSTYGLSAVSPNVIAYADDWLIAYHQGTDDPSGEIYTRQVSVAGLLSEPVIESEIDLGAAVTESSPRLCAYGDDDYFLAWHLRVSQNNAHAILGSQRLGTTPVPELASLNTRIEFGGWIEGLSCASSPAGTWVTWTANDDIYAQLIPHRDAP